MVNSIVNLQEIEIFQLQYQTLIIIRTQKFDHNYITEKFLLDYMKLQEFKLNLNSN
jgi:hypothetical protein